MAKNTEEKQYSFQEILNLIYEEAARFISVGLYDDDNNLKTTLGTTIAGEDLTNDLLKTEVRGTLSYKASAGADQVVKAGAGFLYGIILGTWVDNATLEVSDHASDGDANVVIFLTGDTTDSVDHGYPKYIPVNASFSAGITADITAFTNVTFIYR